ncbi:MAG: hypothetical protein ACOCNC_11415 [Acetivibrio ethanolgignens]
MKLCEMLEQIDNLKPNAYSKKIKVKWISDLDMDIFKNVISNKEDCILKGFEGYKSGVDDEKILLIPSPFTEIYFHFVAAKIDFNNRETESYANNMIMYNELYNDFSSYYIRNHLPKQKYSIRV